MWIPAPRGIEANEMADSLAKQSLNQERIMEVAFSKAEAKTVIRSSIMTDWQYNAIREVKDTFCIK